MSKITANLLKENLEYRILRKHNMYCINPLHLYSVCDNAKRYLKNFAKVEIEVVDDINFKQGISDYLMIKLDKQNRKINR